MRKQKQSHRHHYDPVWLLKRFCNDGVLWWRRQDWPLGRAEKSSPDAKFFKNNLNTHYVADGSKDVQVEDDLVRHDGKIAGITKRLVEQGRQGYSPDLDEEDQASLYWYMFVQYKRSPDLWEGSGECHNARVGAILQSK